MERKFLEEMGIEKDNIDKILNEYHSAVNTVKEEVKTLTTERDDLKGQITTRDNDIAELKKVDAKDLQTKLDELQGSYDTLKIESANNLIATKKNLMVDNILAKSKAKDLDDIKKFIDLDKVSLDNENLIGLNDQLENLTKAKPYLFNEENPAQIDLGGKHDNPITNDDLELREAMGLPIEK